jgi:hypothetical protein
MQRNSHRDAAFKSGGVTPIVGGSVTGWWYRGACLARHLGRYRASSGNGVDDLLEQTISADLTTVSSQASLPDHCALACRVANTLGKPRSSLPQGGPAGAALIALDANTTEPVHSRTWGISRRAEFVSRESGYEI